MSAPWKSWVFLVIINIKLKSTANLLTICKTTYCAFSFINHFPNCFSTGQREVLPDIWGLHDAFIPWGPNRNCALLHHGDLCLCSCHDQRRDCKDKKQQYITPLVTALLLVTPIVCHLSLLSPSLPFRETSALSCSNWQQRSTRTCTVWQWQERALIAIFSVSMWFPNTWEKTHPSLRRYEVFLQVLLLKLPSPQRDIVHKSIIIDLQQYKETDYVQLLTSSYNDEYLRVVTC